MLTTKWLLEEAAQAKPKEYTSDEIVHWQMLKEVSELAAAIDSYSFPPPDSLSSKQPTSKSRLIGKLVRFIELALWAAQFDEYDMRYEWDDVWKNYAFWGRRPRDRKKVTFPLWGYFSASNPAESLLQIVCLCHVLGITQEEIENAIVSSWEWKV